ncbi:MAG: hypothetical protein J4N89_14365 [Chloroflexi bacterium]|nr:hypothetical protein [Chloroflexota bacterium]
MLDYFLDNWGSFVSALGFIATLIGLSFVFRRAGEARTSAVAARAAAQETREAIGSVLTIVDLERAVAMVQRLKQLLRDGKWEVSLELYQPLRVMLTNINARSTIERPDLQGAIPQINLIEQNVARALRRAAEPSGADNFLRQLNRIQIGLEEIASSAHLPGRGNEVR